MEFIKYNTIVVGTGAAGYAAACRLKESGIDVAIVTEDINAGTSRNTGSDKQTYYKLGLAGSSPDSVRRMASDLFSAGAFDGDTALAEAACSVRSFSYLCELGVPFPQTEYGEFVGYKTDHDPYARATSAGPLTSKYMVEALSRRADELGIPIIDGMYASRVLKDENGVAGLLCLERRNQRLVAFSCANLLLATGGPAGIYKSSVYPESQMGSQGLAALSGASLQNLTEWQYGLASLSPRWNVSGTYMQVLPRLVSVGDDGESEFLLDIFDSPYEALSMLFLKGYQWPFDSKKAKDGSSLIDLAVYREAVIRRRRVFLDYRKNPFGLNEIELERLSPEARDYLSGANATQKTPAERLLHMNSPAFELYKSKGVDLSEEMLEISISVQHMNGGVSVNADWESSVCGLYTVGEAAGTHGIARPGGSALNAGQVGALRASESIKRRQRSIPTLSSEVYAEIREEEAFLAPSPSAEGAAEAHAGLREAMSASAGPIRSKDSLGELLSSVMSQIGGLSGFGGTPEERLRLRDALITASCVLTAMLDYCECVSTSRGSAIYTDPCGDIPKGLDETFRHLSGGNAAKDKIQEIRIVNGTPVPSWRSVRPIPEEETVFETVWRRYRERGGSPTSVK